MNFVIPAEIHAQGTAQLICPVCGAFTLAPMGDCMGCSCMLKIGIEAIPFFQVQQQWASA